MATRFEEPQDEGSVKQLSSGTRSTASDPAWK